MPGYFKKFGQKFKLNEWNFQEFMNNWTHHLQPHLHCGQVKSIWSPMTSFFSFTSAGKDLTMLNIYSAYKSLASYGFVLSWSRHSNLSVDSTCPLENGKGFQALILVYFNIYVDMSFQPPFRINTKVFLRILEITTVSVATYILIAWWPYPLVWHSENAIPSGIQRIFL